MALDRQGLTALRRPLPWRAPGASATPRWPIACASGGTSPGIEARYAEFLADHRPLARRIARRPPSAGEAFAAYVRMLTAWRRLRYLDPGLPLDLLPPRWKGVAAAELFDELDRRLRPPADRHAREVLDAG